MESAATVPFSADAPTPKRAGLLVRSFLVVVAGAAVSLAWPTPDVWPLAAPGIALLLTAIREQRPRRRLFLGWIGGTVCFAATFYWVYGTAREMSGFSPVLAALTTAAFAMYHGLLWGGLALATEPLRRASGPWQHLTLPALWCVAEWAFPFVFPIFLGYSFWRVPVLLQVSDLTGVYGLSFVVVLVAVALAEVLARPRRASLRALIPAAAVLAAVLAYGAFRLHDVQTAPARGLVNVALVQPNHTLDEKRSRDARERYGMFQRALDATAGIRDAAQLDLVLWPEGGFPYYMPDMDGSLEGREGDLRLRAARALRQLVDRIGAPIATGSLRRQDQRTRNSLTMVSPGGRPSMRYDKRVLVPFGEYMPLSNVFPSLRRSVKGVSDFDAGERYVRLPVGEFEGLATICYEAIMPGFVHDGLREGGDLLLNVTADLWFGRTRAPWLHLMAQVHRTVEHRVPLVRATATGISALVSDAGVLEATTGLFEEAVLQGAVVVHDVTSPYRAVGDVFLWVVVGLATVVVAVRRVRRRGDRRNTAASSLSNTVELAGGGQ